MLDAILFDLDGTLLPMDNDKFVAGYLGMLYRRLAPYGYEKEAFFSAMWRGVAAMVKNDLSRRNDEVFWESFIRDMGEGIRDKLPLFDRFYEEEFDLARSFTEPSERATEIVAIARERASRVILATNPFFPPIATQKRIKWAGLRESDFDLVTHYENSGSCKPNPLYYKEIIQKLSLDPERCVMVGNNTEEDIAAAATLGMKTFLVTDNLILKGEMPTCPCGGFDELEKYLRAL